MPLHEPQITAELREGAPEPDDTGQLWRTFTRTSRACTVCPCGTTTGFIPRSEALGVFQNHKERDG